MVKSLQFITSYSTESEPMFQSVLIAITWCEVRAWAELNVPCFKFRTMTAVKLHNAAWAKWCQKHLEFIACLILILNQFVRIVNWFWIILCALWIQKQFAVIKFFVSLLLLYDPIGCWPTVLESVTYIAWRINTQVKCARVVFQCESCNLLDVDLATILNLLVSPLVEIGNSSYPCRIIDMIGESNTYIQSTMLH